MANDELDFDKYKSVVDYISANTGTISASLQALIENTLATRSDSVLNVVSSGSAVKKINVGAVTIDIENGIWKSEVPISLDLNGFENLIIRDEGEIPDNALLPSLLTDEIISKIATSYITKTAIASEVLHAYTATVTAFNGDQVPSLQYFFDNYYSINDVELDKKVILTSRDVNDDNNVVTYAIADILSGAKKSDKAILAATKFFTSNLIHMDEDRTELKFVPTSVSLAGGTTIKNARSNKSVILQDMIGNYLVRRDLRNADQFSMQEPQDDNMDYVATEVFVDSQLSGKGKVTQKDVDIEQTTINGLTTNYLSSSYYGFGTDSEVECFGDILKFNIVETALRSDKDTDGSIGSSAKVVLNDLRDDAGSARNRATSIKTLYAMISATLSAKYPDIMIDASEKLALSSQLNLIIQDTDFSFGARPVMNTDEELSEIATFSYIPESMGEVEISNRELSATGWGDYVN